MAGGRARQSCPVACSVVGTMGVHLASGWSFWGGLPLLGPAAQGVRDAWGGGCGGIHFESLLGTFNFCEKPIFT